MLCYNSFGNKKTEEYTVKKCLSASLMCGDLLDLKNTVSQLEEAGIEEGDTVRMYGLVFDYYK